MRRLRELGLGPLLLAVTSCNWLSLARHALTYRTTAAGETANIVASGDVLFATLADEGIAVVDIATGARLATIPPPHGAESVDDLALDGALLFALDARPPGHIAVYAIDDPLRRTPRQVAAAREVPVGPFSGIAASGGVGVVSGGTSQLTVWRYDASGLLEGPIATGDFGRGQPDVSLSAAQPFAVVSTHYWGPYFGVDLVRLDTARLALLAELALDGAGFTAGGAKPATFPIVTAALDGRTLLVAYARGLAVIDVADPRHPRLVQTLALGGPAVSLAVRDSTALVAVSGRQPALVLLEFAAGREARRRRLPLPSGTIPAGVALTATHAAAAVVPGGIRIFPRNP